MEDDYTALESGTFASSVKIQFYVHIQGNWLKLSRKQFFIAVFILCLYIFFRKVSTLQIPFSCVCY